GRLHHHVEDHSVHRGFRRQASGFRRVFIVPKVPVEKQDRSRPNQRSQAHVRDLSAPLGEICRGRRVTHHAIICRNRRASDRSQREQPSEVLGRYVQRARPNAKLIACYTTREEFGGFSRRLCRFVFFLLLFFRFFRNRGA